MLFQRFEDKIKYKHSPLQVTNKQEKKKEMKEVKREGDVKIPLRENNWLAK